MGFIVCYIILSLHDKWLNYEIVETCYHFLCVPFAIAIIITVYGGEHLIFDAMVYMIYTIG